MLKILLSGACGRMGRQVANLAEEERAVITAGVDVRAEQGAFSAERGIVLFPPR